MSLYSPATTTRGISYDFVGHSYLYTYVVLASATILLLGLRTILPMSRGIAAGEFSLLMRIGWISSALHPARSIYAELVIKVLGARTRFFDVTPVGESQLCEFLTQLLLKSFSVINRLSRDTASIDREISDRLAFFLLEVAWTASIVVSICVSAVPQPCRRNADTLKADGHAFFYLIRSSCRPLLQLDLSPVFDWS